MPSRRLNVRKLVRRCRGVVDRLDIPEPFDISELCARVGEHRGQPVLLVPLELSAKGPCGLWLDTPQADYIVFESNTSPLHRNHIILHELAHLLCHRRGAHTLDAEILQGLFPALDPTLVRSVLGRGRYSAVEEQEAEIFAHLVLDRAWDLTWATFQT